MQAQLTVRLPGQIAAELAAIAKKRHCRKSDVVREALEQLIRAETAADEPCPFNKVRHLMGAVATGINDLGEAHRQHLARKLRRDG
ncbi:MAG: hypothetical protein AB1634_00920 [Thermodesulfobacteriota bacterium]